jgi:hypothetical protein
MGSDALLPHLLGKLHHPPLHLRVALNTAETGWMLAEELPKKKEVVSL